MPTPSSIDLLKIATRGSELALTQAGHVARAMEEAGVCRRAELVVIKTTGDKIQDRSLAKIGGKGLFIKELEEAMLRGEVRAAIHSMKDVPAEMPAPFSIHSVLPRADARDVLVTLGGARSLAALPPDFVLGTSSQRRCALVHRVRPDARVVPLRGNVGTRIQKLKDGVDGLQATLLAAAGLNRLGLNLDHAVPLSTDEVLPAVTQGILGVEIRSDDDELRTALSAVQHAPTVVAFEAERGFLEALGGSCTTPVAAYAEVDGESFHLRAVLAHPSGEPSVSGEVRGPSDEARMRGAALAHELLDGGGRQILAGLDSLAEPGSDH